MTRARLVAVTGAALIFGCSTPEMTESHVPLNAQSVGETARGAELAVTATIEKVEPYLGTNRYGDKLIFSRATLRVEETLKGVPSSGVVVDVEGGTLNGMRLEVSDVPKVQAGERGVFFLERAGQVFVPHHRGQGLLKLDERNQVRGSALKLDDVRKLVGTHP